MLRGRTFNTRMSGKGILDYGTVNQRKIMRRSYSVLGGWIAASSLLFLSAQILAAEQRLRRPEPDRMPHAVPNAPAPQQEKWSASFDLQGAQHAAFDFTVGAPGRIAVDIQFKGDAVTGSLIKPGGEVVPLSSASALEYMASADDIKKGKQWKVDISLVPPKSAPRNAVLISNARASGNLTILRPAGGGDSPRGSREIHKNANSAAARVADQPLKQAPAALAQPVMAKRKGETASDPAGIPGQQQYQPASQGADQQQYQPAQQDANQSQYQPAPQDASQQPNQPAPQDSNQSQYPQPNQPAPQDANPSQYPQPNQPAPQDANPSQYPQPNQPAPQDANPSQYPQPYQPAPQDSNQSQYPQQPNLPTVQSSLQQQPQQNQQPNYQGQQYQGQQYQSQQYQGQQYQGQQYQGQQYQGQQYQGQQYQGQQYQGQQYQGQQPPIQQQNQAQPAYSPGIGAAGGSCTVKLSVDRSTLNLVDANTGSERKHLSLGQDRVQKVFSSPDNAWSVAVYKIRGAQQYGFIALELAKCEDQLPVDLPAVPTEARFDQAEVVLTIDNKEKRFRLRNSRMQ